MKFYPGDLVRFGYYDAIVLAEPDVTNCAMVRQSCNQLEVLWNLNLCNLISPVNPHFHVGDLIAPRVGLGGTHDNITAILLAQVTGIYEQDSTRIDLIVLQHEDISFLGTTFSYRKSSLFITHQEFGYTPPNDYTEVDINHYFLPGHEIVIDPELYPRNHYLFTDERMITGEAIEMDNNFDGYELKLKITKHLNPNYEGEICDVNPLYFKLKNPLSSTMFNENDIICFNPESTGGKEIYKYINTHMQEAQILEMGEDGRLLRIQVLKHEDPAKIGYITLVDAKFFTLLRKAEEYTITLITGEEVTYVWREHRLLKSGKYALKSDFALVLIGESWYHPTEFDKFGIVLDNRTGGYNYASIMNNGIVDTRGSIGFFSGSRIQYAVEHDEVGDFYEDPLYENTSDLDRDLFREEFIYFMDSSIAEHYDIIHCPALDKYIHRSRWQDRVRESRNSNHYRSGYHSLSDRNFSNNSLYQIGVEIEKEDSEVLISATADEMYNKHGWRKERDGSLNDSNGFEFISPIYDLEDANGRMAKDFETEIIANHINAESSERCGGHMNLSCKEKSAADVFKSIEGYLPLLYAMYPNRVGATYCKAKPKKEYQYQDKYSAIHIKGARNSIGSIVEFRIFPAITTVNQLKWRIGLIRLMLKYPTADPKRVIKFLSSERHELHKHMIKIYGEAEKILVRIKRMYKYMAEIDDEQVAAPEIEQVVTNFQTKNIPMYVLTE